MDATKILIRPVLTEKMTALGDAKHYGFKVAKEANKIQIARAVEDFYPGVQVKEVRTMIVRGKARRQMTKRGVLAGRRASWKKAIVTLASGEINFYEEI
ncbi:MAG TPA: 50S ribosomal protein L23 [Rhodothermales bacterium]|nr:50S ribosomal protein L23 [Bacteroidota bacterium]HRK73672.1 50S ribosomal protein L23 [Rhodothermales bacterium]HRR09698.1 50S ribosomal protein L23 [Rhodothermales bacterium]